MRNCLGNLNTAIDYLNSSMKEIQKLSLFNIVAFYKAVTDIYRGTTILFVNIQPCFLNKTNA